MTVLFTWQVFPSVVPETGADEFSVAADTSQNSRREIMANKKNTPNTSNKNTGTGATARDLEFEADVLFQRIYDKWYAFSVVEDDCLMTEVTEEEVQKRVGAKKTPRAA